MSENTTYLVIVTGDVILAMNKIVERFGNWMNPNIVCPKISECDTSLTDYESSILYRCGGVISLDMNVSYRFDIVRQVEKYMKENDHLYGVAKLIQHKDL